MKLSNDQIVRGLVAQLPRVLKNEQPNERLVVRFEGTNFKIECDYTLESLGRVIARYKKGIPYGGANKPVRLPKPALRPAYRKGAFEGEPENQAQYRALYGLDPDGRVAA